MVSVGCGEPTGQVETRKDHTHHTLQKNPKSSLPTSRLRQQCYVLVMDRTDDVPHKPQQTTPEVAEQVFVELTKQVGYCMRCVCS